MGWIAKPIALVAILSISACTTTGTGTRSSPLDLSALPSQRLLSISDLVYQGAFAMPDTQYGVSSMNWAAGPLHVENGALYIAGHDHQDDIAEFQIPQLTNTVQIGDLRYSPDPRQIFAQVLDQSRVNNFENLDQILGIEHHNGALVVNAIENYDAPGDNRLSTVVVKNANDLSASNVVGLHAINGRARAAGWLSEIPPEWRPHLGGTHISGASSGGPIISRLSVGPSAFAINLDAVVAADRPSYFKTRELLGFNLDHPLNRDLFNESGANNLWTHVSEARYGFIVPGTRTYMTVGISGGHRSGVGYKVTQDNGVECKGYCSNRVADNDNFYWLWDVADLVRVARGKLAPYQVKPYDSGVLKLPFQGDSGFNPVGGGSYDPRTGLLSLTILRANDTLDKFSNPPVVIAFRVAA